MKNFNTIREGTAICVIFIAVTAQLGKVHPPKKKNSCG
jgi:hypothetical protein